MCGIFGAINLGGVFEQKDFDRFRAATDIVSYRGPDAYGYRSFNVHRKPASDSSSFNLFLGHRRLSIIDLSDAGTQPFFDGNELSITFNGEIFNYIELRKDLIHKGYHFTTDTDTEVILKVYREYGIEGFSKFNGMWAFILVDLQGGKVVVSRDRFSQKPLYYFRQNSCYYFASEIKQLLPLLGQRIVNQNILYTYLTQGLIDYSDETFFDGISKVKPMHTMVFDFARQTMLEHRYWNYSHEEVPLSEDSAIEKFREIFVDAVKIRLRSDVPVGCLLSGGLDSSSISMIAGTLSNNIVKCYSVVSSDKRYSEEQFIDLVCAKGHFPSTKLQFQSESAWEYLEKTIWHNDEPCPQFSAVAQYQILDLIKRNSDITVVLSGQGSDEILCGYLKFFFFYLEEQWKKKEVLAPARLALSALIKGTVLNQFRIADAKRYIGFLNRRKQHAIGQILSFSGKLQSIWEMDTLRSRQIRDIDHYSVPALAHYEDRNSMAHSLEIRLPFLDHRLVNYALSLPGSLKIRDGWTKYILRKAIHELPEEVRYRKDKQGFLNPEEKWLRNDFKAKITTLFSSSRLHEAGFIRKDRLLAMYENYLQEDLLIATSDISRFVMAETWMRQFFERPESLNVEQKRVPIEVGEQRGKKRFLIVHTWGIGDWLHFSPVVRGLQQHYPEAVIDVLLGTPSAKSLVELYPGITIRGIVDVRKTRWAMVAEVMRLLPNSYAALLFSAGQDHEKADKLAMLIRAKTKVALLVGKTPPRFLNRWDFFDPEQHMVDNNLKLLDLLGIPSKGCMPFVPFIGEMACIPGSVLIHPGSDKAHSYKRWPAERFVSIARALLERGRVVSVLLGYDELDLAAEFQVLLGMPGFTIYRPSLAELIELIFAHETIFNSDSSIGHIAAALGKNVVSVFGPSEISRHRPYSKKSVVITAPRPLTCMPCMKRGGRCGCEERQCLMAVDESLVLNVPFFGLSLPAQQAEGIYADASIYPDITC